MRSSLCGVTALILLLANDAKLVTGNKTALTRLTEELQEQEAQEAAREAALKDFSERLQRYEDQAAVLESAVQGRDDALRQQAEVIGALFADLGDPDASGSINYIASFSTSLFKHLTHRLSDSGANTASSAAGQSIDSLDVLLRRGRNSTSSGGRRLVA